MSGNQFFPDSIRLMSAKALQVRGVPDEVLRVMRRRPEAEGMRLAAYLRRLVIEAAAQPTVAEVLARASRRSTGLSMADFVHVTRAARGHRPGRAQSMRVEVL